MQNPPDLRAITLLGTTNAVANTSKVDTVLAAPGAGLRYRIWGLIFGTSNNATTDFVTNGYLHNPAVVRAIFTATRAFNQPQSEVYPPGGYAIDTNISLDFETFCSAASQQYRLTVFYTIERNG